MTNLTTILPTSQPRPSRIGRGPVRVRTLTVIRWIAADGDFADGAGDRLGAGGALHHLLCVPGGRGNAPHVRCLERSSGIAGSRTAAVLAGRPGGGGGP